jgi:hypothetical protein
MSKSCSGFQLYLIFTAIIDTKFVQLMLHCCVCCDVELKMHSNNYQCLFSVIWASQSKLLSNHEMNEKKWLFTYQP